MIGSTSGVNWERVLLVYVLLIGFGCWYNRQVAAWQRDGKDEGFVGLEVAGGVLMTLLGSAAVLWGRAFDALSLLLLLGTFGAAGGWMIAGSLGRYSERRARAKATLRQEIRDP